MAFIVHVQTTIVPSSSLPADRAQRNGAVTSTQANCRQRGTLAFVMDLCACCMVEQERQLHKRFVNTLCSLADAKTCGTSVAVLIRGKIKCRAASKRCLQMTAAADCCSGQFFAQIIAMQCL